MKIKSLDSYIMRRDVLDHCGKRLKVPRKVAMKIWIFEFMESDNDYRDRLLKELDRQIERRAHDSQRNSTSICVSSKTRV